jgi:hypothetical protein
LCDVYVSACYTGLIWFADGKVVPNSGKQERDEALANPYI